MGCGAIFACDSTVVFGGPACHVMSVGFYRMVKGAKCVAQVGHWTVGEMC